MRKYWFCVKYDFSNFHKISMFRDTPSEKKRFLQKVHIFFRNLNYNGFSDNLREFIIITDSLQFFTLSTFSYKKKRACASILMLFL